MTDFSSLGRFDTPSRNWWVSYNGGIAVGAIVGAGVHEFIFRGDDSLTGGIVRLVGGSVGVSWGIGKMGKSRSGGTGTQPTTNKPGREALDTIEQGVNVGDAANDSAELHRNSAPWCDMNQSSLLRARRPFSLHELNRAWGGIEGIVSADGMLVGGALLKINGSMSAVSSYDPADENTLFEGWTLYNINEGAIGINIGMLQGKWSVVDNGDIYHQRCPIKAGPGLETFYSSNPALQTLPDL